MKQKFLHTISIFPAALLALPLFFACKKNNNQNNNPPVITVSKPLIDFGTGIYRGHQGGLYPGGSNVRPSTHHAHGLSMAQSIQPLNPSGNIDTTNGNIVWMSIGMSNCTQETQAFLPLAQNFTNRNPKLVLIDGAQGGQDINAINSTMATYWNTVTNRLTTAGLTAAQVQVIWFKEAEAGPVDTAFATYPEALKIKYKSVMQILKNKFPNLKLCYLSDRIYAGYATTLLNPEPFAWYTGWCVKRLIADQIAGDAALRYSGTNPPAAWLSWGPYLWAKGDSTRSDGLVWLPADFAADGTHPSTSGRQKVAQMLLQFFTTDETCKPWFLKP
jgi:hypothetical protein